MTGANRKSDKKRRDMVSEKKCRRERERESEGVNI